jgi:hypothetical protein
MRIGTRRSALVSMVCRDERALFQAARIFSDINLYFLNVAAIQPGSNSQSANVLPVEAVLSQVDFHFLVTVHVAFALSLDYNALTCNVSRFCTACVW